MQLAISLDVLEQHKTLDLIPCLCDGCGREFTRTKKEINKTIKHVGLNAKLYCCHKCHGASRIIGRKELTCIECGKQFERRPSQLRIHKERGYKNSFCSRRCRGLYGAKHKTTGTQRSRLECWIESQLKEEYPLLDIKYNDNTAIQAELDIYIPSLKVAFELNGIFHYEPIFGQTTLDRTQNKDTYKLHACTKMNIDLCVIDTSSSRYFKPERSIKYLSIIKSIIKQRLESQVGHAPTPLSV